MGNIIVQALEERLAKLNKVHKKIMATINEKPIDTEYFECLKIINSCLKNKTKVPLDILKRGAYLEKNLVKLHNVQQNKINKAWEERPKIEHEIEILSNELWLLGVRHANE